MCVCAAGWAGRAGSRWGGSAAVWGFGPPAHSVQLQRQSWLRALCAGQLPYGTAKAASGRGQANRVSRCGQTWGLLRNVLTLPKHRSSSAYLHVCCVSGGFDAFIPLSLQVSHLGWLEKKTASALFEAPPTATVQDALQNFLRVMQAEEGVATQQMQSRAWSWSSCVLLKPPAPHVLRGASPVTGTCGRKAGESKNFVIQ